VPRVGVAGQQAQRKLGLAEAGEHRAADGVGVLLDGVLACLGRDLTAV
jgi:hypothetical protein